MDPTSYIQIINSFHGQNLNPTPQQRAVFGFYDARHSEAAEDIYSSEWLRLTRSFFEAFAREDSPPITLTSWEMVEDLDFGAFFLAHPIAAYSLWHMLQSCYELDRVVCGTSAAQLEKVATWQKLKPFIYLKSKKIRTTWKSSLKLLKKQIDCGALEGEELMSKLNAILYGVEKLENALYDMQQNFKINLKDLKYADVMLEKAVKVVEERQRMIADLIYLDGGDAASESDGETSNDETLGSGPELSTPTEDTFPRAEHNSSALRDTGRSSKRSSRQEVRETTVGIDNFSIFAGAFCFGLFLALLYILSQSNWAEQLYM